MSEPFLGEIRCFGFNFAPQGWAMCDGQLMSISQNTALFSLLGTQYGGDGQSTFALPDLQGRVGMHMSSVHVQGESAGEDSHTLSSGEMPAHAHGIGASANKNSIYPSTHVSAKGGAYSTARNSSMAPTDATGGSAPHNNLQPYLVLNYCIALFGIFPSRG